MLPIINIPGIIDKSEMPGGLSFFTLSPSPDRVKEKTTLCSLCLCGENNLSIQWIWG